MTESDTIYCPITRQIFNDPVIAEDGFVYERTEIQKWLDTKSSSPITRESMGKNLNKCNYMKQLVKSHLETHPEEKDNVYKINNILIATSVMSVVNNFSEYNKILLTNLSGDKIGALTRKLTKEIIDKIVDLEQVYYDNWKLIHYICRYRNC